MKAIILWLLCCLLATAAGDDKPAPSGEQPLNIDSALVTVIEEVEVPARVEGVLISVEAQEGQIVERGVELARIDDTESRLTHERAGIEAEIARRQARSDIKLRLAKTAAAVAQVELKRARESVDKYKKSVSETELDKLRLSADKAELEVEQSVQDHELAELTLKLKEAELGLAQQAVERRRIVAPLAGVVVQVNHHSGEWVQPGQTVLRVLQMDPLRVESFVAARSLTGDIVGRRAQLTIDIPGAPGSQFSGKVAFVSPEVNPVNGQVRVWVDVANPKLILRPGLQGRLAIFPASDAK